MTDEIQHDETWYNEAGFRHDGGLTDEAQRMLDYIFLPPK
jgi:hypothetical protein